MVSPMRLLLFVLPCLLLPSSSTIAAAQGVDYWNTTVFYTNRTALLAASSKGNFTEWQSTISNCTSINDGITNLTNALRNAPVMSDAGSRAYLANATNRFEPALHRMADAFKANEDNVTVHNNLAVRMFTVGAFNETRNSTAKWFVALGGKVSPSTVQMAKTIAAQLDQEWLDLVNAYMS